MEIDLRAVRERFRELSREELVEEAALRADEYIPAARLILEGEVRDRGISAAELEKARCAAAGPAAEAEVESTIDFPALLVSAMEKEPMRELAAALRRGGIPALVREMDQRGCGHRGPAIGRWGNRRPGDADRGGRAAAREPPAAAGGASRRRRVRERLLILRERAGSDRRGVARGRRLVEDGLPGRGREGPVVEDLPELRGDASEGSRESGPAAAAWGGIFSNLRGGARLALFRKVGPEELHATAGAFAALALFELLLHNALALAEIGRQGEFRPTSLAYAVVHVPLMLFAGLCIARLARREELALALPVAYLALGVPVEIAGALLRASPAPEWLEGRGADLAGGRYYFLFGWWALASLAATLRMAPPPWPRRLGAAAAVALALLLPLWQTPRVDLWVREYEDETASEAPDPAGEEAIYAQPQLLQRALAGILPGRRGVEDLYFVGFAGDGSEDVFLKEIEVIARLFRERFDASGRSVLLVNNERTATEYPFATATALERSLRRVGRVMDRDEDVLVLYLTSHGSEDHELTTDLWPYDFQQIDPAALREMLDRSGIGWRVIVVSACYSGGFVDSLRDERTLVMTASDASSNSFGCGNDSDFTWFGKALFDEQLRRTRSFTAAFAGAAASISRREKEEGEDPSNPQIFVGERMRGYLPRLEARLESLGR